ncbi:hypothetical protein [Pseudomonas sp. BW7P1]|uniref:hypothetical protein n=1 Tax=Pseudomonas TaxID=286 RepID=UPI0021ADFF63|nr:hypothetical protein [Pseudomonas sp. BW7P1]UWI60122.1 hypothetical protein NWV16_18665 [Pseudomonas sp. BW7P1]
MSRLKLAYARTSLRLVHAKGTLVKWSGQHGFKLLTTIAAIAFGTTLIMVPALQRASNGFFIIPENLAALKSLLAGTSSALIGATAIAFSLILFAMQVNVERMPHGLFKRLSSDWILLGNFLTSFLSALTVGSLSLIPSSELATLAITITIWAIVLILSLFILSYRRALLLISPIAQLSIMTKQITKELTRWEGRAEKARLLIQNLQVHPDAAADINEIQFDSAKARFFQINAGWDRNARQAVQYSISYAQRFSEVGDHEVADSAINGVMLINATYCGVKNRTFIGDNLLIQTPGSTDGFINSTLECFRQMMRMALSRGDEQLAENTLRGIASVLGVYLGIDYPGRNTSKKHAGLASGYLESAVESVIPHNMPDVLMEGLRLMGKSAQAMLTSTSSPEIISLANKIALISYTGMVKADFRPVTLTAFEQLSTITFELLVNAKDDIRYPVAEIRSAIKSAALNFLEVPSNSLTSIHSSNLAPYYSSASTNSLRHKLAHLINELLNSPADNENAIRIIGNIEIWADQIYLSHKELLLKAVNKRSGLTFDLLHWASGISEMLLATANSPACDEHEKENLCNHAIRLISTISWLPDDVESVRFAENSSVTEIIFDAALTGLKWNSEDYYTSAEDLLLQWAMKGGQHQNGWGILTRSILGLCGLSLDQKQGNVDSLKQKIKTALAKPSSPPLDLRQSSARELRREAGAYRHRGMIFSKIDNVLAQRDQAALSTLLLEIAALLDGND